MKFRKKSKYPHDSVKIARIARTLGHPARIEILRQLASADVTYFNEIAKVLPLAESTVSQHLAELKRAGLINGISIPPKVKYSINTKNWRVARKYFKELTKMMIRKNE